MTERPPVRATARVLTAGTAGSALLLLAALVLGAAQLEEVSRTIATAGAMVLLATPVLGLVVTVFELRPLQPRASWLALLVLAILGVATLVALLSV